MSMSYKNLADNTRVWVYQSNRPFSIQEAELIQEQGKMFLKRWSAHGAKLNAAFEIIHNLFVALFVDEEQAKATGCSIDKSVHLIKSFEKEFAIKLLDRNYVAFRAGKDILVLSRRQFLEKVRKGELNHDTTVFNNLVSTKKEFETKWEVPLKESWYYEMI